MINAILTGIFNVIISLVNVILSPIDTLISTYLPDLANGISAIGQLFATIGTSIGWAISLTGISNACISLIVTYYVFKLTVPMFFYLIKLALAWYNKLKI